MADTAARLEQVRKRAEEAYQKAQALFNEWTVAAPSSELDELEGRARAAFDEHHRLFRESEALWEEARREEDMRRLDR